MIEEEDKEGEIAMAVEGERQLRKKYPKDEIEGIEMDRCFSGPILKPS